MRSLFSIATVALIAAGAQAQHNGHYPLPNLGQLQGNEPVQQPMQHPPSEQGTDRDVLFTEDFANGLVGNNGVGSWTLEGANGNIWRFNNHSPTGAYTSGNQYIQSTTAANDEKSLTLFSHLFFFDYLKTEKTNDPVIYV